MKYPILLLLWTAVFSHSSLAARQVPCLTPAGIQLKEAGVCTEPHSPQYRRTAFIGAGLERISKTNKGSGISEKEAASIAERAHGGSVIKVSRQGKIYNVRLLKDGVVRTVKVDATSGKIVKK